MSQPTKKELIAKIVKEQGVDPKSLERLNLVALQKMDAAVPDKDEDLLGSSSESSEPVGESVSSEDGVSIVTPSESSTEESPVSTETSQELPAESSSDSGSGSGVVEKVLLGYHPVSEAPIYSDEQ